MHTGSLVLLMYTNLRKRRNKGFFKKENGENERDKDEDERDITVPGVF